MKRNIVAVRTLHRNPIHLSTTRSIFALVRLDVISLVPINSVLVPIVLVPILALIFTGLVSMTPILVSILIAPLTP